MKDISRYVIIFIHPASQTQIYLAKNADIDHICYCESPSLPGTLHIGYAKSYVDVSSAKADIYKLRYHYREFLKVKAIIMRTTEPECDVDSLSQSVVDYDFSAVENT